MSGLPHACLNQRGNALGAPGPRQSARRVGGAAANAATRQPHCRACGHGDGVAVVSIPFVFKYLTNELAAMNIKTTLRV